MDRWYQISPEWNIFSILCHNCNDITSIMKHEINLQLYWSVCHTTVRFKICINLIWHVLYHWSKFHLNRITYKYINAHREIASYVGTYTSTRRALSLSLSLFLNKLISNTVSWLYCETTSYSWTYNNVIINNTALFWTKVRPEMLKCLLANITVECEIRFCVIICNNVVHQHRHVKVLVCVWHCVEFLFIQNKSTFMFAL